MRFRELRDPDEKRKQLLWLACTLIIFLSGWVLMAVLM